MKVKVLICGFGRVGQAFSELLDSKKDRLKDQHNLEINVVGAVDLFGAATGHGKEECLPLKDLLAFVKQGGRVDEFPHFGRKELKGKETILETEPDILVEATPTNILDGEPGLTHIRTALKRRVHVISANKGPLVLKFGELKSLAEKQGVELRFGAATAAALPTVDLAHYCLAGCEISQIEGILNGTTNYILTRMQDSECTLEEALSEAQGMGIAEKDPALDLKAWDTANKLILIANEVFGCNLSLSDVTVSGILGITREKIVDARNQGKVIKLIGRVSTQNNQVVVSVSPESLSIKDPLARVNGAEKGITFITDSMGRITVMGGKSSPKAAAAALLKDLVNIYRGNL